MPNKVMIERWRSGSRHKAGRRQDHAELSGLADDINQFLGYMADSESPLKVAQSLIDFAYMKSLFGIDNDAMRDYGLAINVLVSMERTAKNEAAEGDGLHTLVIDRVIEMKAYAISELARLSGATAPANPLEQITASARLTSEHSSRNYSKRSA